jgi:predicted dehydrogenase
MEEYLRLLASNTISIEGLSKIEFPISKVAEAFSALQSKSKKPLFVFLDYGNFKNERLDAYLTKPRSIKVVEREKKEGAISVALIGAGSFATGTHLPNLSRLSNKFNVRYIVDKSGPNAKSVAAQYRVPYATTEIDEALRDEKVELVVICTRHSSHAPLVLKSLQAGKHTFVEKPLATNADDLKRIKDFYSENPSVMKPLLMVGFNRRFSPFAREIKQHTSERNNPLFIHYRMNAGYLPSEHWVHQDGGRIIGEGCHIIDLMSYFTEAKIKSISVENLTPNGTKFSSSDNRSIVLKFMDGSVCVIDYFATGNKEFPKEYMEVHFDEKTIILDDYKSLKGYGVEINDAVTSKSDKGHYNELVSLSDAITSKPLRFPIELWDLIQTTEISFLAAK